MYAVCSEQDGEGDGAMFHVVSLFFRDALTQRLSETGRNSREQVVDVICPVWSVKSPSRVSGRVECFVVLHGGSLSNVGNQSSVSISRFHRKAR